MSIRFRKPELGPTIAVILIAALMFSLSAWQLERLEWKNNLLASIEKAQTEPPRELLSYSAATLADAQWHNVIATGRFLHDKELYAMPRYYKEQMGYAILTPLAISTPQGTQYVLINRGWVPPGKKEPSTRTEGNPPQTVKVEGVIRSGFKHPFMRPDNVPQKNLWFWYDLPAMERATGLKFMPVMIDATRVTLENGTPVQEGPTPFPLEISIRNDHLGYAITWFLIGLSAIVMFGFYYLERKPGSAASS